MAEETLTPKRRGIFYGWWITLSGVVLSGFGYGAWFYNFGNFFNPIRQEFGWSRAVTSTAFSLSRLEGGVEALLTGPLVDRFGPRGVIRVGWAMAGLGFILMYFISSLWMFYLSYSLLISLGMNAGLYVPLQKAVSVWFNRRRGIALGILTSGAALGGSVLVPFCAWLIYLYGWRTTAVFLGIACLALGQSLAFVVRPFGPERYGLAPDGEQVSAKPKAFEHLSLVPKEIRGQGAELSAKEALRTSSFWVLVVVLTIAYIAMAAINVHQIPHLTDIGIDPVVAAATMGFLTLVSVPGRLAAGFLADRWRWDLKYLLMIALFFQGVGLLVFAQVSSLSWLWVYLVVFGLAFGARVPLEPALRARYFGSKAFATIGGFIACFAVLGALVAPVYAGWAYDVTGSYRQAFYMIAGVTIFGALLLFLLRPPRPRAGAPR